ncbi:hypothetical protein, partial [Vibrio cholerae]|uniref:hypothetical protein n=1 Tax=Vibrio cholerae TaxID=666 RepID=UPI001F2402FF
ACRHPEDKQIPALEKEALARIARFCLSSQRIESVDFTRQDKEGLHLVLGHYLRAEGGVEDDRAVLLYAWKVVLMSRGVK